MLPSSSMANKKWEPAALAALPVSLILAAHLLLLTGIVTLMVLTHQLNGFVEIKTKEHSFLKSVGQDLSFVWNSLPPFIMQFLALARNWTADEAAFREPFAELRKTDCHDDNPSHTSTSTVTPPPSNPEPNPKHNPPPATHDQTPISPSS